jgi:hypothetical protein
MIKFIIGTIIGAGFGYYFSQVSTCANGLCPLPVTPWFSMIFWGGYGVCCFLYIFSSVTYIINEVDNFIFTELVT